MIRKSRGSQESAGTWKPFTRAPNKFTLQGGCSGRGRTDDQLAQFSQKML